jgi:hypothetical protein
MADLSCDSWDGFTSLNERVGDASVADLVRALETLDATSHTMVTVSFGDAKHLAIGGGAGQYVVYATFDTEEFWNLRRAPPIKGIVVLNVGGHVGTYPASHVVGLDQAKAAACAFLEEGRLDPMQPWDKQ